jgi:hypothetical protein
MKKEKKPTFLLHKGSNVLFPDGNLGRNGRILQVYTTTAQWPNNTRIAIAQRHEND